MRARAVLFLLILSIFIGAAAYALAYFLVPSESPGRGYGTAIQRYVWIPIAIVPVTFSIGLLAYLALFPEIKQKTLTKPEVLEKTKPLSAVMRVLRDDERKIIELLVSSGGKMLQRDLGRQAGFSRVKTHRILYRLATRGIVTAEKHYNTYEITLADWLSSEKR
jgi:uncharacterized membrane protein